MNDPTIEAVKEAVRGIELPNNSRLILGGSLVRKDRPFRPDSDIDIWLLTTIPDRVEIEDGIKFIHQEYVESFRVERQLPTYILGHRVHFLVPCDHPVTLMIPDMSDGSDEYIVLKERTK